ncbi:MAG: hypothetical protein IKI62_06500 [Clostridia bacterium]|nr:hypothetical protein [Clostridia bacterium]
MKENERYKRNIKISLGFFITLFVILIIYMGYSVIKNGASWYATPYNPRISTARDNITGGAIYDRKGVKLAWSEGTKRVYIGNENARRSCSHVLGDVYGKTIGAETTFAKYLYGLDNDIGTLINRFITGDYAGANGSDITLSIDSELSKHIYSKMGGKRGSVVVMNYKTGEILSSVSILTFDPKTVNTEHLKDTALVDRATMGRYAPGSIMKIVTASKAIEKNIDLTYTCTGKEIINGQVVTCTHKHGEQNLEEAFANSCNTYFAKLSVEIGGRDLLKQAERFRFNTAFDYSDIILYRSNFEVSQDEGDVAWAGIGQYNDLVTPMHVAMIGGAVANKGIMVEPKLLLKVGNTEQKSIFSNGTSVISPAVASRLKDMMKKVVDEGTGTTASISGINVYGKTGTAEYYEDGEIKNHSWFVGFMDEERPYVVSVIFEGAGFGSKYAAPMVKTVFQYMIGHGY